MAALVNNGDSAFEGQQIDISEQAIWRDDPELLRLLLKDKTTGEFILWASGDYAALGPEYAPTCQIRPELITGERRTLIQPRVVKSQVTRKNRTKETAEVFTPAWLCLAMIQEWDAAVFGNPDTFFTRTGMEWQYNPAPIPFADTLFNRRPAWLKYVDYRILTPCCGEAPFLAGRYDVTTGTLLPVPQRIGLLDRKLRVIGENTHTPKDWLRYALRALQNVYAYELQGDSLLIARENLLCSVIEHFYHRWGQETPIPNHKNALHAFAAVIAHNLWQMDGLTGAAPFSKNTSPQMELSLDGENPNSRPARICLWRRTPPRDRFIPFIHLLDSSSRIHPNSLRFMKFDFVIGNPPYQDTQSGNKMSRSIYPLFVESAKQVGKKVSMVIPARWMSGESGPYRETDGFIGKFLDGNHVSRFCLYPNSTDLFNKSVDIKGGVCYFLWDKNYTKDSVNYSIFENGRTSCDTVSFRTVENTIIRFPLLISILKKSRSHSEDSMKKLVSSWNPFGFVSDLFTKNNENVSRISEKKKAKNDYCICGLLKSKRVERYIPNHELKKGIQGAHAYKVFLPRANGSGVFGEVFSTPMIGTPMIGTPMMICTDTFLQVGEFDNKSQAENLLKYIKTKYFRAMVGIKKTAVFNYKECFTFVPQQDFTNESDIDWTQDIPQIDRQLYKKYDLSAEEIQFIEERIKPMK